MKYEKLTEIAFPFFETEKCHNKLKKNYLTTSGGKKKVQMLANCAM